MQPWFLETPPAALLEDINDNTVPTILSSSLFPLPSTEFPIPLLAWHPTDRTAGVGMLWSQRTRRTGRRDREKDGERMKRLEKKDGRSKTKIPRGPMRPEPDSKLEKICSEFLDWDPPEISLSLDPSTHTLSLSSLSLSIYLFLSLFRAHLVLVARLTWNADKRYLYPLAPPRIFDLSFRFDFGIPRAKHLRVRRKFPRSHSTTKK